MTTYRLVACAIYYLVWINLLPKLKHYQIRQTILELEDGEVAHSLVKVSNEDIDKWDAEHDAAGRLVHRRGYVEHEESKGPLDKI